MQGKAGASWGALSVLFATFNCCCKQATKISMEGENK